VVPVRASTQGMGAERRARGLRGNVRVCSAPFVLAKIFNMIHYQKAGRLRM